MKEILIAATLAMLTNRAEAQTEGNVLYDGAGKKLRPEVCYGTPTATPKPTGSPCLPPGEELSISSEDLARTRSPTPTRTPDPIRCRKVEVQDGTGLTHVVCCEDDHGHFDCDATERR